MQNKKEIKLHRKALGPKRARAYYSRQHRSVTRSIRVPIPKSNGDSLNGTKITHQIRRTRKVTCAVIEPNKDPKTGDIKNPTKKEQSNEGNS